MNYLPSKNTAKYKNARLSILIVFAFSLLNLILLFSDSYMLFSARIPLVIATVGFLLKTQTLENFYLILGIVIAILTIIPYILCWLFSQKRVGWMIAALVIFAVDTVVLLIDLPSYLQAGDFSIFLDIIVHGIVIYELVVGVIAGKNLKKEEEQAKVQQQQSLPETESEQEVEMETATEPEQTRTLTITRKKSFIGCAVGIILSVNGTPVGVIKNGQTETLTVPMTDFQLGTVLPNGFAGNSATVPADEQPLKYTIQIKAGFTSSTIAIVKE